MTANRATSLVFGLVVTVSGLVFAAPLLIGG
jgi:hypothetical protein